MMNQESLVGFLKRCAFGVALVASVILFFYLFENWRGQRAWNRFTRELTGQGKSLDWRDFVAKTVPDDQNFMATPVMEGLAYQAQTDPVVWAKFESSPLFHYSC